MNKFVVTSKGFIKNIIFNPEKLKHEIFFTSSLRDAKLFTGKGANQFLKKFDLEGFIYLSI